MAPHSHGSTAALLFVCLAASGCNSESGGDDCAYSDLNGDSYGCGGSPPYVKPEVMPYVEVSVLHAGCELEKKEDHPNTLCKADVERWHWHRRSVKVLFSLEGERWEELTFGVDAGLTFWDPTKWGPNGEGDSEAVWSCGNWEKEVGDGFTLVCHWEPGMPKQTTLEKSYYGVDDFCDEDTPLSFQGHEPSWYRLYVGDGGPSGFAPVYPAQERLRYYEVKHDAFVCP